MLDKKLKDLVAFDEEVRNRINQAQQAKIDSKQKVAEDKKAISEATWDDVKQRVKDEKIKLDEYIKTMAEENKKEFSTSSKKLNHLYEANKIKWIDELVANSLKL